MYEIRILRPEAQMTHVVAKVKTELESYKIVDDLENAWNEWMSKGYPQLSPDNPIQFYEGAEVIMVRDDGVKFCLNDQNQWEIMH